jgi:hypothetical protein
MNPLSVNCRKICSVKHQLCNRRVNEGHFWHVYVLGGAYFVWTWKSRAPHRDIVTSQRGHWPLLIRVSGITWRGSKLLEASRNVNIDTRYVCTCVGAGSGMGGGRKKHTYCCYADRLYFLTCDMYKSSLRHIHDPVLSSLKMKGILFFIVVNCFSLIGSIFVKWNNCTFIFLML